MEKFEIKGSYGPYSLKNPILIAPGQLTRNFNQVLKIKKAGYAGCVLKSVVGEDKDGNCSMVRMRKPPTYIKTVYDEDDKERKFPIIHWNGRADTRTLSEYLDFAKETIKLMDESFLIVASILCHLPAPDEDFKKKEWIFTTGRLFEIGYRIFEIDFCPYLKIEDELVEKNNILRWYRQVPSFLKSVSEKIIVYPKILNLDYGMDFQIKMVESSLEGKADGVVIANRIFKKEFGTAHGGRELRERNLKMIKEIKKRFPEIKISATGGIYSGKHIIEYMEAGAENVQLLSFLMGRVKVDSEGENKFEKVFNKLISEVIELKSF